MKNKYYKIILVISALLISASSAFFSVYGISALFSGASLSVSIMASSLELGKLVVASFLYRFWKNINKVMKYYFCVSLVVLMVITSAGIFGYLSSAYSRTSLSLKNSDSKVLVLENKKKLIDTEKNRLTERLDRLNKSQVDNENRINSLYEKNQLGTVRKISVSNNSINGQVSVLNDRIDSLNTVITKIDENILDINNLASTNDVGPLKYIALAFGTNTDTVVKFFILILIFVFDPLAVGLIIAFNVVLKHEQENKILNNENKIIENDNKISENKEVEIIKNDNIDNKEIITNNTEETKLPNNSEEIKSTNNDEIITENEIVENDTKNINDEFIENTEDGITEIVKNDENKNIDKNYIKKNKDRLLNLFDNVIKKNKSERETIVKKEDNTEIVKNENENTKVDDKLWKSSNYKG